jgi:hypothetical protein
VVRTFSGRALVAAELAPLLEVHRVRDGAEHDVRRDCRDGESVAAARFDEVVRDGAVRLLPREEHGRAGRAQRGDEPVRLGPPAPPGPPHQAAEHDLGRPHEAGRVLEVGDGHAADLLPQMRLVGPEQAQAE